MLVAEGAVQCVEAGELLWQSGDERSGQGYIVTKGLFRLFHPSRSGNVVTLLAVAPGGILGYQGASKRKTHLSGAEAVYASQVLSVPVVRLESLLQASDAVGQAFTSWFGNTMFQQLAETDTRLELEHDSAKAKVAHVLLALDAQGCLDRLTRQTIADLANLSLETTVRQISRLLKEGVLGSSHFTALTLKERLALAELLEDYEPVQLPYL